MSSVQGNSSFTGVVNQAASLPTLNVGTLTASNQTSITHDVASLSVGSLTVSDASTTTGITNTGTLLNTGNVSVQGSLQYEQLPVQVLTADQILTASMSGMTYMLDPAAAMEITLISSPTAGQHFTFFVVTSAHDVNITMPGTNRINGTIVATDGNAGHNVANKGTVTIVATTPRGATLHFVCVGNTGWVVTGQVVENANITLTP